MIQYAANGDSQALFYVIEADDRVLLGSSENTWYSALYFFAWETIRELGADYYTSLSDFNRKQAVRRWEGKSVAGLMNNPLSRSDAEIEFLFNRDTMKESESEKRILFHQELIALDTHDWRCTAEEIAPGQTPPIVAGRQPKCFFALFKAFLGTVLQGISPTPENVFQLLNSNPSFARVCGFVIPHRDAPYHAQHIPSLRKLEQFDQIMTDYGLWRKAQVNEVSRNLSDGVIKPERIIVGDTTHYHAFSGFKTIEYTDEKGKAKKKSQSRMTKNCSCTNHQSCPHEWVPADEGAGTVVKSNHKMYWAHKASIIGFPGQDIPLDMIAVDDAATHDSLTFVPHVEELLKTYSGLEAVVEVALYDSACDIEKLRDTLKDKFGITLKTTVNPKRRLPVTDNLPKGLASISPYGTVTCNGAYELDYRGRRKEDQAYVFTAPVTDEGKPVCETCPLKSACCNNTNTAGRRVQLSWDFFPSINPDDPQIAHRFKQTMKKRPAVERMIKRLKCDLSSPYLTKRGNKAFQAYLDKTMMAYHILLRLQN